MEDFNGTLIRLANWCQDPPYLIMTNHSGVVTCDGGYIKLLNIIARKLNFTYEWFPATFDGEVGSYLNGNWSGMFYELLHDNRHLTINRVMLNEERGTNFDYTNTIDFAEFGIIAMQDQLSPWMNLLIPLSNEAWLILFTLVFLFLFVLKVIFKSDLTIQVLRIFLSQSTNLKNLSSSKKVWVGCWMWSIFVIMSLYSAKLASILTVEIGIPHIKSVEQAVETGLPFVMPSQGGYIKKTMVYPKFQKAELISKNVEFISGPNRLTKAVSCLQAKSHFVITFLSIFERLRSSYNITNSYVIEEKVLHSNTVFFLKKNSWMTKPINRVLTRIKEAGILQKLVNDYRKEHKRNNVRRHAPLPLTLRNMEGGFWIWIFGLLAGCVAFLVEITKQPKITTESGTKISEGHMNI